MSKCPHCGAEVQYSPKDHVIHCDYCGSNFKPSELIAEYKKAKKIEEEINAPKFQGVSYTCSQCGATLLSFDETAVTFCSYCDSQNVLEDKLVEQVAPDYIIPFSKTQEECINNYKKKVKNSLFCPNYMKSDLVVKKFRGIYMPYGIYNLNFKGDCVNHGEKFSHRAGDYLYYDKYDLHADVDSSYNGISFDLLSKFYDEYSQAIPFNYKEAVPFNANYLPGFYADCKDVDQKLYEHDAKMLAKEDSTRLLLHNHTYRKYNCDEPTISYDVKESKTGLFPVYFASVRDKDNKHIHYAIINGQTGKVAADLPVDFKKYLIFSVLVAIPLFFIINSQLTVLPTTINLFAIAMAIIGSFVFSSQVHTFKARENRETDRGLKSAEYKEKKKNVKAKEPKVKSPKETGLYYLKIIPALLIPIAVVFINPVHDYYYYGAAIISLILILLSFSDLVSIHNRLTARDLPQLEKRGGDESE